MSTSPARRRLVLGALAASALGTQGCATLRNPCARPGDAGHAIAPRLLERLWDGLDPGRFIDAHVHVVGNLTAGPDAQSWINPAMTRVFNPFLFAHFAVFADASCVIERPSEAGDAYVRRLSELVAEFPPGARFLLLALDGWHDASGAWVPGNTILKVGNGFVASLARAHPRRFAWAASIHPHRPDALDELDSAARDGAVAVKWIPYLMGIDPASPRCRPFYARMARLRLPLIVHAGWQHSLVSAGDQEWGNPLRLRSALDAGVKVVAAHCATQGDLRDDDSRGAPAVPAFDLLRRLVEEPRYRGLIFGDLSGVVSSGRAPVMVRELVRDERWRGHLVNGSDYPLPGAPMLTSLSRLVELGFVAGDDAASIAHIQAHNPLLFDFALKRLLRVDGRAIDAAVFRGADGRLFTR